MKRADIFRAIRVERARQDAKFPGQWAEFSCDFTHPFFGRPARLEALAILSEEAGEVAKAVLEADEPGLELELVQVAAVCVAWLEARA